MKTVLIIQNELPHYRDFLWEGLRKVFDLYFVESNRDRLLLPNGTETQFSSFKFASRPDYMIVNAGIREAAKALFYVFKYRARTVIGWTQYVGKNKSYLSRFLKGLYLLSIYDKVILYYEHEKCLVPFNSLLNITVSANNTVGDWDRSTKTLIDSGSFLFVGRYTEKSNLKLLLEATLKFDDLFLHIIGVNQNDVPSKYHVRNIVFHGNITQLEKVAEIASQCAYFVYPGDVGLSIVHAIKMGLIPIVHSNLGAHMPECRAVAETFPVIYFQHDDSASLNNILSLLKEQKIAKEMREGLSSRGFEIFSEDIMIKNFLNILGGN